MLYNQGVASNKMLEEGFLLYCIIPCRDWIPTVFVFCEKLKSLKTRDGSQDIIAHFQRAIFPFIEMSYMETQP